MYDEQLQQKLLAAAVPAPAGVWDEIAVWLDEVAADKPYKTKLNDVEIFPADKHWNWIEQELNEQKEDAVLASLLQRAEITPPSLEWEQLETRLDEAENEVWANQLQQAAVTPPVAAWSHIEEQLPQLGKVISIQKSNRQWYRLAAAAVITGLIAWGAFQLFSNRTTSDSVVVTVPAATDQNKINQEAIVEAPAPIADVSTSQPSAAKQTVATVAKRKNRFKSVSNDQWAAHEAPVAKTSSFTETNYLLVLDEKGDLIRVSKKLSTMDCAKNTEVPVDAVTALQLKDCEDKIKRLQQRMATAISGIIPDPGILSATTEK
jgi:hypothetical protein